LQNTRKKKEGSMGSHMISTLVTLEGWRDHRHFQQMFL
jgi:hypothetical protein